MKIKIIATLARNGVIGHTSAPCTCGGILRSPPDCGCDGSGRVAVNGAPWAPHPEDLGRFEDETRDQVVLTDWRTWDRMLRAGRPLLGKIYSIVSPMVVELGLPQGAQCGAATFRMALSAPSVIDQPVVYVYGDPALYAAALPLASELVLTQLAQPHPGDLVFPHGELFGDPDTRHVVHEGAVPWSFTRTRRHKGKDAQITFTRWRRA